MCYGVWIYSSVGHSQLLIIEDVEQLLHQSIAGQGLVADNAGEVTLAL